MTDRENELSAKVREYEKRMGIGENDPAKDGYLVLVNILRQQNDYLGKLKLTDIIGTEDKSKAASEYERAKGLWEKLPTMIQSVNSLKHELKMEGEEKKTMYVPVSASSLEEED